MKIRSDSGFTLIGVLFTIALLAIFVDLNLMFFRSLNSSTVDSRRSSTKDRITSSIRNVARMPATLRNSARAALPDGSPANPALLKCVGSTFTNGCKNGEEFPLTLYSPIVALSPSGAPLGLLPISNPLNSSDNQLHFDSYGVPCDNAGPDCPFTISTSFRAQCPPPILPLVALPPTDPNYLTYFTPMNNCTIAEVIEIIYTVQVDPAVAAAHAELNKFSRPFSGAVSTSVRLVFNNEPQ